VTGAGELEAQGEDVIHQDRFAEEIAGSELRLLNGCGGCVDEDGIADFSADVAGFTVFEDIDDEPDLAMTTVAGLPCSAVRNGKTDEARRQDGWALSAERCQRHYE
jgi:hypothetical protein